MPSFQISEKEWLALEGEPLMIFKAYCIIRRCINFKTGVTCNLSEDNFRRNLVVRMIPGRKKKDIINCVDITQKKIRSIINRLEKIGLIECFGSYVFCCKLATLDKRNQNSKGVAGARTRAQRREQKNTNDPLSNQALNNGIGDNEGRDISTSRGVLQDTGINENNNTIVLFQKKKASKLTDEFCVTENHIAIANKNGFPDPYDEIDAFKDFHISKGNTYMDWDRAFYTWLRNAKRFNRSGNNATHKQSHRQSKLDLFDEINNRFIKNAEQAERFIDAEFTVS
jgi:hypothetical protein